MSSQPHLTRREWLRLMTVLPLAGWAAKLVGQGRSTPLWDEQEKRPNILILVFDSLSAEHTSLHGYRRNTTPFLKKFAEKATVYHRHHSAGNFTTPATASLLTGCLPWTHRGLHFSGSVHRQFVQRSLFHLFANTPYYRIAASHNLLVMNLLDQFQAGLDEIVSPGELSLGGDSVAESFFSDDYTPAYWAESLHRGASNPIPGSYFFSLLNRISQEIHRNRLSRDYSAQFPKGLPSYGKGLFFLPENAVFWLQAFWESAPRPTLAYIHLYPPHEPYTPAGPFIGRFEDRWSPANKPFHPFSQGYTPERLAVLRQDYDEYLAYTDHVFSQLYRGLEKSGALENTILVVTSDHGQLFERGIHGHETPTLYNPLTRIPLLVTLPGQTRRQDIHSLTSTVDLLPTLLQLAGQPLPEWLDGRVLPGIGGIEDPDRMIFSIEGKRNGKNSPLNQATMAIWRGSHKLILYQGYRELNHSTELFNLSEDPEERANLASSQPSLATELKSLLISQLRKAEANLSVK